MAESPSVVSTASSDYDPQLSSVSQGITLASLTSSTIELHNHKDTNFGEPSNNEALLPGSPLSDETLEFEDLSLSENPHPRNPTGLYQAPFQRGVPPREEPNPVDYAPREPSRKSYGYRGSGHYASRGPAYPQFRAGVSSEDQLRQAFLVVRNSMRRQFKNAEVAKWKFEDYKAHVEAMHVAKVESMARKAMAKDIQFDPSFPISEEVQENLRHWGVEGNFNQEGNRSRILGELTIWCKDWQNGKEEIAPWPTIGEQKWEGDDRSKTGVGRFLPLPREEGSPALPWNQLEMVRQYPIDQTCRIPTLEDVYAPVDEIPEDEAPRYLHITLIDAIDDAGNV